MISTSWGSRVLGVVASAMVALPLALIASPTAAAAPCPDIQVVFARGTNEAPGVGGNGQAFVDSLRALVAPREVSVYGVNYPATDQFDASTTAGMNDTSGGMQWMATNCPNTRMVLGGYSQGVAVIEFATNAVPAEVANHVAAVVEFGSPRSSFAHGLWKNPLMPINPAYAGKTLDLCVPGDPICTEGGFLAFAHGAYAFAGMTQEAAEFAAAKL